MATIDDDIAYLKAEIDRLLQRTPDKPDGRPEALSSGDWIKIREMRTERNALTRERWQSLTTPRERLSLQMKISKIVKKIQTSHIP